MMRLRRGSVIAVFSLLAWAATASAECAWIWWAITGEESDIAGGYTTKQECEKAISMLEPSLKTTTLKVSRILDGNRLMVRSVQSSKEFATVHSCLPDTIDPRGPKGK